MASFLNGIRRSRRGCFAAAGQLRGYGAFWLKAFSQPTIDLTLRTHTGLTHPDRRKSGPVAVAAELDALVSQLRIVAAKTLPPAA